MRALLISLYLLCFTALGLADQTNVLFTVEVYKSDGAYERYTVRVPTWTIGSDTNANCEIQNASISSVLHPLSTNVMIGTEENPVKHIYCNSNSISIGEVVLTAESDGLKVKKLIVDGAPQGGKSMVKKADVYVVDAGYGVQYTATNNVTWLHWIDEAGTPQTTQISASPEIPLEERSRLMDEKRSRVNKTRSKWDGQGQIQNRLEQVEKLLGLRPLDE